MPPLEMAPGSFYAAQGSAEADQLYDQARNGEFRVSSSNTGYLVFSPLDMDPSMAAAAFTMETGDMVIFNREFNPTDPDFFESKTPNNKNSEVGSMIGRKSIIEAIKRALGR